MKKISLLFGVLLCFGVNAQTWDGSGISTTTTSGNVGIGTYSSTVRANINTTSNSIVGNFASTINNAYNGTQAAISNTATYSGTGFKYALHNMMTSSSATSTDYVFRNEGLSSGVGSSAVGMLNTVNKTGSAGTVSGILNNVMTSSSHEAHGILTNIFGVGSGVRYGYRVNMTNLGGTGSGDRYGFYADLSATGPGKRYGIYSVATGTGAKSAYLQGDVELNQGNMSFTATNGNRTLLLNNAAAGQNSFSITPNATSNQDDWQWGKSFILDRNGEMIKRCTDINKVFSVSRFDLGKDVFRVYGDGTVYATRVKVMLMSAFPDYVFDPSYQLMPLSEVKSFIQENGHLPNVPTASEVSADGLDVGETTRVLVEKVEELTLYLIQQQAEIEALKKELSEKK